MDRQACLSNFHFIRVPIFFAPYIFLFAKAHQLRGFSFNLTLYSLYFILYSFHFPLTSLPVFAWHATIVLLEAFVEIALIHKADFETNLGDGIFSFED